MASKRLLVVPSADLSLVKQSYLTSEEVCALIRVSPKTLQRMRKERKIMFMRRPGRVIFPATEVARYIKDRLVLAA